MNVYLFLNEVCVFLMEDPYVKINNKRTGNKRIVTLVIIPQSIEERRKKIKGFDLWGGFEL